MRVGELIEQLAAMNPNDAVEFTCLFCGGETEPQVVLEADRIVVMCKECTARPDNSD